MERIFLGQVDEKAAPLRMILRSGTEFRGKAAGAEGELFVLHLVDDTNEVTGRRVWVRACEVAALEIAEPVLSQPLRASDDEVDSLEELYSRVHTWRHSQEWSVPVDFEWRDAEVRPKTLVAAWKMFLVAEEALIALRAEHWMKALMDQRVQSLVLVEERGTRLRVEQDKLELSFLAEEPTLPMRELAGLLASIL